MRNRLKELRKAKGLTLEALAQRVGSSNQHVSHLENGKRRLSVDWMERLATALECHPLELLHDGVLARTKQEQGLLEVFRGLSAEQQEALLVALTALARPERRSEGERTKMKG
jgi:transcriptional regulator with XRE-family HTH domain